MSAIKHAVLLTMSVLAAYLYLQMPLLKQYSLQAFALIAAVYLIVQKQQRGSVTLILPENTSANLALINFAFLLLTGASGSLASPFFAITFVQLFFLALSAASKTALMVVLEVMVFHFSLSIGVSDNFVLSTAELSNLLALPLVMVFYLFGKYQYEKAYRNSLLVDAEARELSRAQSDDQAVSHFVSSLLNRRLPMLEFLLSSPLKNKTALDGEIKVLKEDLSVLTRAIDKKNQARDLKMETLIEEVEIETSFAKK